MGDAAKATVASLDAGKTPVLGITFPSGKAVSKPGEFISKGDAGKPPTLSYSAPSSTGKYIAFEIDLDAPFPTLPFLGPILHWIQSDLVPSSSGELVPEGGAAPITPYGPPRPPPISSPHRYVFLLYEQPADWDRLKLGVPEHWGIKERVKWNQGHFEKKAGLGHVVAGNYFKSK